MGFGGYHPHPKRFGGNKHEGKPLLQVVHESLNAQRGAAFDTDSETSIAAVETMAWARAIVFDGWELNARLGHQWDARRTTDMLPRWERIFKIRPAPGASDRERRDELAERWARFGGVSNHARLTTALSETLGDYFVAVEYISLANAVVHAPDGTYPWGTVVSGVPWYSTVAHILVRLQKPAGATEAQFYEAAGKVVTQLDPIVSSFVTFDWYRPGPIGTAISGGPSAAGFYLDDEHNLDNEVFDAPDATFSGLIGPSLAHLWSDYSSATGVWVDTIGAAHGIVTAGTPIERTTNGHQYPEFDGVDTGLVVPAGIDTLDDLRSWSIFGAFKTNAGDAYGTLIAKQQQFYIENSGSNTMYPSSYNSGDISGSVLVNTDTWVRFVVTCNDTTAKLYVNGALDGTTTWEAQEGVVNPLGLGCLGLPTSRTMNAGIAVLGIATRGLSSAEAVALDAILAAYV